MSSQEIHLRWHPSTTFGYLHLHEKIGSGPWFLPSSLCESSRYVKILLGFWYYRMADSIPPLSPLQNREWHCWDRVEDNKCQDPKSYPTCLEYESPAHF